MRLIVTFVIIAALFILLPFLANAATPQTAVFAGGCFWSMEHAFEKTDGVTDLKAGFSGGTVANPSYEQVVAGGTGQLESVQITYDPTKISYERLLNIYWRNTDPLDASGQFCDKGENYHPAVFTSNPEEKAIAETDKAVLAKKFGKPITTDIRPAMPFYAAEEYHQHYADKHPVQYGLYRQGCGRDRALKALWGDEAGGDKFRTAL